MWLRIFQSLYTRRLWSCLVAMCLKLSQTRGNVTCGSWASYQVIVLQLPTQTSPPPPPMTGWINLPDKIPEPDPAVWKIFRPNDWLAQLTLTHWNKFSWQRFINRLKHALIHNKWPCTSHYVYNSFRGICTSTAQNDKLIHILKSFSGLNVEVGTRILFDSSDCESGSSLQGSKQKKLLKLLTVLPRSFWN